MDREATPLTKLQSLLRELLQLDHADLDFGIYRLLRLKADEVSTFLEEDLPSAVDEAFEAVGEAERSEIEAEVDRLAERIREDVADDAVRPDGSVADEYRDVKAKAIRELVESYEEARGHLDEIRTTEGRQAEVFNHLYSFFRRYYEQGDFVPKRRYGAQERYAIPYNGEETLLHWANRGQHYVKNAEVFRDYAFTVEGDLLEDPCRVRFVLTDAQVPPGDTKGDRRYFFPEPERVEWNEDARELTMPFQYRLPTEKEAGRFGRTRVQESILDESLDGLKDALPEGNIRAALLPESAGEEAEEGDDAPAPLMRHLRRFVRRNTSDYFVHRDLKGFLERELEFYVKDQVLHLADLNADLAPRQRMLLVLRSVAGRVITFLAQLEEVQKRLFEKRKFVLRADYLVLISAVPEALWQEVLDNQEQIDEWERLFRIDPKKDLFNPEGEVNRAFLEAHPTLVVNTALFDEGFRDRVLESFGDIDEATGGILIYSENYQALRLLEPRFRGQIKCIYIDPPYNTGSDDFLYKDRYQHSSWLTMMEERLRLGRALMSSDGIAFLSIDDTEMPRLLALLARRGDLRAQGSFVWKRRSSSALRAQPISVDHEYVLAVSKVPGDPVLHGLAKNEESYPLEDSRGRYASTDLSVGMTRHQRPGQFYPITNPRSGITYDPNPERVWRFTQETMKEVIANGLVIWPDEAGGQMTRPRYKTYFDPEGARPRPLSSWLASSGTNDIEHDEAEPDWDTEILSTDMNQAGGRVVDNLFGSKVATYPKPVSLIRSFVRAATHSGDLVIDFFAGSGTTAHSVISLNREDAGARRFLLVESSDLLDDVTIPRIEKVLFSAAWRDGKPIQSHLTDQVTHPLYKILRLESYEDALHNLAAEDTLDRAESRSAALKKAKGDGHHRLHYLARLPLESGASMLDVAKLAHPFDYELEVLTDAGPERRRVDLVETFNLLHGLRVQRMERWVNEDDDGRTYRAVTGTDPEGQRTLVLWRDMTELDPAVERTFLEERIDASGGAPFDAMLINGDSTVPGLRSLDPVFKARMEEGEA